MTRVAAALTALLLAGCAGGAEPGQRPLTVLAAASLADALGDLPAGTPVTYSFAGSQQLVAQVEAGAPADVVATADDVSMDRLVRAGLVDTPRRLAGNRLAIAVPPGNPGAVTALADLARPGLRVAVADPSVPAGRYARQALDRAGARVRPVSFELDVRAVVARVVSGEADAGIAYITDVRSTYGVEGVAIDDEANVAVVYRVGVVRATGDPVRARAYVERLLGPAGREALAARGFSLP